MTFHQLSSDTNPILISSGVVAGTSDTQTFTEISLTPQYNSVYFLAFIGTVTSTGTATLQAKGSYTSGTYGAGTVGIFEHPDSGSNVQAQATTGDSNTLLFIDENRTQVPYARGQIVRATANVVIGAVIGMLYASEVGSVVPTGVATHSTLTNTPGWDRTSNPTLSSS